MRAANIQLHGAGRSTWICVPNHHSLRTQIRDREGYDIRKHETEWFLDLDTLLTYDEKVTVVNQDKIGDLVLLGPDVMHWVRATGKAICIAWNFIMCKTHIFGPELSILCILILICHRYAHKIFCIFY